MNSKEPRKALKHRKLVEYGIEDAEYFADTKFFYDAKDLHKCLNETEKRFIKDKEYKTGFNMLYLVTDEATQNIPNLIFRNLDEFKKIREQLKATDLSKISQIWHVRNTPQQDTILGRIAFNVNNIVNIEKQDSQFLEILYNPNKSFIDNAYLELVKGQSLRQIDKYPIIDEGYMRLKKMKNMDNSFPYFKTEEFIAKTANANQLTQDKEEILKQLSKYQDRIIKFTQYLKKHGAIEVSFDFSYSDKGGLQFFDWDTGDDKFVIDNIIAEEQAKKLSKQKSTYQNNEIIQ